jgi:hypothetical protein
MSRHNIRLGRAGRQTSYRLVLTQSSGTSHERDSEAPRAVWTIAWGSPGEIHTRRQALPGPGLKPAKQPWPGARSPRKEVLPGKSRLSAANGLSHRRARRSWPRRYKVPHREHADALHTLHTP